MTTIAVQAKNLSSCIGKNNLLKDISFKVERESITSVLGPSGSGKTTLLKTIAGFQPICQGELLVNGHCVSRPGFTQTPDKRNVGMVFQDHALFSHLTVLENITTGLHSHASSTNKLDRLIEKLDLRHLQKRHPHELSGGQQQRTALARALVAEPDIILLDEPFANLNQDLQIEVGIELVDILREQKATALMVTHDQNDAMAISDNIIILMHGHFIQSGSPQQLYNNPATREVAAFLSRGSFIKANFLDQNKAQTTLGTITINMPENKILQQGDTIDIWLHPEDILVDSEGGQHVAVVDRSWRPLDLLLKIRTDDDQELLIKTDQHSNVSEAKNLQVKLNNLTTYSAFT